MKLTIELEHSEYTTGVVALAQLGQRLIAALRQPEDVAALKSSFEAFKLAIPAIITTAVETAIKGDLSALDHISKDLLTEADKITSGLTYPPAQNVK